MKRPMTRTRVLMVLLLGLTSTLLLVSTAAADTHDEEFLYEVYSGLPLRYGAPYPGPPGLVDFPPWTVGSSHH